MSEQALGENKKFIKSYKGQGIVGSPEGTHDTKKRNEIPKFSMHGRCYINSFLYNALSQF